VVLPPLRDVLACITASNANETYSSEGAETLGDCVLDYLASIYLFNTLP
jgi:dsRNA-specific ribonuclease